MQGLEVAERREGAHLTNMSASHNWGLCRVR